jgi:hypothetical protein
MMRLLPDPARWRAALLAACGLVLAASVGFVSLPSAPALGAQTTTVSEAARTFSGQAAWQQVDALAGQIGSRPVGSAAYDQAAQYAADQLRLWGYQPTLQRFTVESYADRGSQVEIIGGNGGRLAANTLTYSVAGQVEGPLVAVG